LVFDSSFPVPYAVKDEACIDGKGGWNEKQSIVHEEAAAYFAGQRSAEEVSHRIQSRAELYLSEQG
jgi:hypothetical protein